MLDLTLTLREGLIETDVYADSHLYLSYSSSHPLHCKQVIPNGWGGSGGSVEPAKMKKKTLIF